MLYFRTTHIWEKEKKDLLNENKSQPQKCKFSGQFFDQLRASDDQILTTKQCVKCLVMNKETIWSSTIILIQYPDYFGGKGVYVVTEALRRYSGARSREVHAQFVRRADLCMTPDRLEKRRGRPRPLAAAAYSVMIRSL